MLLFTITNQKNVSEGFIESKKYLLQKDFWTHILREFGYYTHHTIRVIIEMIVVGIDVIVPSKFG